MRYIRSPIEVEAPEELGQVIHHNLSESAVGDRSLASLGISIPPDLLLTYAPHLGSDRFRSLIAQRSGLVPQDILVTAGASAALFMVATSLLRKDDHVVITRPNYASNIETPRAIGCEISYVDLSFDDGFAVDWNRIAASMRSNTKLISLTTPSNPMGTSISNEQLDNIVQLAKDHGCYVLIDETYAELVYDRQLSSYASLGNHVIGVSSMSKAYGVPGIRVGWISCKDEDLRETFLAAKEQISIAVSVLDEYVAEQILEHAEEILRPIREGVKQRRELVDQWVRHEDLIEWVRPDSGVMGFMRMSKEPASGTAAFYEHLLNEYGAYVGPGRWFEWPDTYFRLGYGWPSLESLKQGLEAISKAMRVEV